MDWKGLVSRKSLAYIVAVSWAFFQLYAYLSLIDIMSLIVVHITFALILTYLVKPLRKPFDKVVDPILIAITLITCGYYISIIGLMTERIPYITPLTTNDLVFGSLLIVLVLEAVRRQAGNVLTLFIIVFILYWLFGSSLPGVLRHTVSPRLIFEQISLSTAGVFGTLAYISSTYVYAFILFSALLYGTGIGKFYIDLALASVGRSRGGGAKTAIIASMLFGTITGASVADVLATGTFTIPLMKNLGYPPVFAGAVAAIAGTGAQITPPILGSAAFIIAEVLGIGYLRVCVAAIVPAIVFYATLFIITDLIAQRDKLLGVKIGIGWKDVARNSYLLIPLIILIYRLAVVTPLMAAVDSIMVTLILITLKTLIIERKPRNLKIIFDSLGNGSIEASNIASILAGIGIVVGVFSMTGLGLKITSGIMQLSQGNTALILVLTMLICLLLGMGMPTTAAYILTTAVAAPLLIERGFDKLAVHMFVFYYACLSAVTPPVAVAVYAADALAGSGLFETGFMAFKLGLAGYILPYLFLLYGDLIYPSFTTIPRLALVLTAVMAISIAIVGYFKEKLNLLWRACFMASAIPLLLPHWVFNIIGVIAFALLVLTISIKGKTTPRRS